MLIPSLRLSREDGMGKPYSIDLRERVVAAIEGGMSTHEAAARFAIGIATGGTWARLKRATENPPEDQSDWNLRIPSVQGGQKDNPRITPRVLLDGADSVGVFGDSGDPDRDDQDGHQAAPSAARAPTRGPWRAR